jgi:hypothetical protein
MRPFKPPAPAPTRALSPRTLSPLARGDDQAERIFDVTLLHVRARVPSLAHHPLHELEVLFGDLKLEIAEIRARRNQEALEKPQCSPAMNRASINTGVSITNIRFTATMRRAGCSA